MRSSASLPRCRPALLTPVNLLDYRRRNDLSRTPGAETTVSFVLVSLPIVRAAIDLAVRHRCPATAGVAPQWPLRARRRFPYIPVIASPALATLAVVAVPGPEPGSLRPDSEGRCHAGLDHCGGGCAVEMVWVADAAARRRCQRRSTATSWRSTRSSTSSVADVDNLSANKTPTVGAWAIRNKVELCFTPTSASWANPIEAQFGPLCTFTMGASDHPNHAALARRLQARHTHA